ncbi:O-antigen ligase family protein [Henriciella litoralis]|uniref:O-antigen ligase family protein n=1 Tax=Henriciella litoralis TaxID=568102 RepID=UPI0009FCF6DE|nr:O-antigen ligase [Henriciella litoralis]
MPALQTASQDRSPFITLLLVVELVAAFICLVLFTEGLLPRLFSTEYGNDTSAFLRKMWIPVYLLVLGGCAWKLPTLFKTTIRLPFLIILLVLVAASTTWSIDPEVTERRAIAVIASTMAGLFLAVRYDWRTLIRLFGAVWFFMALVAFTAGLVAPGFAIMDEIHPGAWKGLWWEKNALGGHMARASFILGFLVLLDKPLRPLWVGGTLLCIALVLLSTSKTALLGLLLGFGVLAGAAWMRRGVFTTISSIWLGVVLVGLFASVMTLAPGVIFQLLGRDATLTGRTDIWAVLISAIGDRPWLGYGYGAFWGLESMPAYRVRMATEWLVPTAHNGWLETALAIGLLGVGALLMNYLLLMIRASWLAVSSWMGVFVLGVSLQYLLFSLSESIALQQNTIVWVTYVTVVAKTALTTRDMTKKQPERVPPGAATPSVGRAGLVSPRRNPGLLRTR